MIRAKFFAQPGADADSIEHWGWLRFVIAPQIGDRFMVWRQYKAQHLEIMQIDQYPVIDEPSPDHEPIWPVTQSEPELWIHARLI